MFCNKCGGENPEDGTFCQKCGASLSGAATAEPGTTPAVPKGGITDMLSGLPIKAFLLFGAIGVLALGLLYGILAAAANPWHDGAYAFAEFLKGLIYGTVGGGVLLALSEIIPRK